MRVPRFDVVSQVSFGSQECSTKALEMEGIQEAEVEGLKKKS